MQSKRPRTVPVATTTHRFVCNFCSYCFNMYQQYEQHLLHTCHQPASTNVHCNHCSSSFRSRTAFLFHCQRLDDDTSHFVTPPHIAPSAHSHSSTSSLEYGQHWDSHSISSDISSTPHSLSTSRLSSILPSVIPETPPSTISPTVHNVKHPTPTAVPVTTCAFQWLPVTPRLNMNTMPILLLSHINAQYSLITYLSLLLFWLTAQFRQVPAIHWPPLVSSDHLRFLLSLSPHWPNQITSHTPLDQIICYLHQQLHSILFNPAK